MNCKIFMIILNWLGSSQARADSNLILFYTQRTDLQQYEGLENPNFYNHYKSYAVKMPITNPPTIMKRNRGP